jgi:hypothetical protein
MVALLIVVVLTVLFAVGLEIRARREFAEDGSAFRCRFRRHGEPPASWPELRRYWSRHMWARWSNNMLVVRRGPIGDRVVRVIATVRPVGVYYRSGGSDIAVKLEIDGANVEMTAAAHQRLELVGPFLAAAVRDLPPAPTPRYPV